MRGGWGVGGRCPRSRLATCSLDASQLAPGVISVECVAACALTYFSSTNCFWYSSYSSRVIPAALAGSVGVASSSLSPPPPKPIPDRGFPIMLFSRKAISTWWDCLLDPDENVFSGNQILCCLCAATGSSAANLLLLYGAKDTLTTSNRHKHTLTHTHTQHFAWAIIWI